MTVTVPQDLGSPVAPVGPSMTREPDRVRWVLVAIIVIGGVLRLGWGLAALNGVPESWMTGGDQYSYWYYGNEIADGDGYISYVTHVGTAYYPIGYPATLAGLFWLQEHTPLGDDQPTAVAVLHALMSTASIWFAWLVGRSALGVRGGLVAAAIVALFPNLILYVPTYALETAFVFWSLAALAVIATHDWSSGPPSVRRLVAFGVVLGLSIVVRPFSIPFLVGLAVALAATGVGWRRVLQSVGIVLLPIVLILTPWTIRNLGAMDGFVPISTNLGDTACIDRSEDADGGFRWAVHDGCADSELPEVERNRENIGKAIDFVVSHPVKELELIGKRFGRMLEHDHSGLYESDAMTEDGEVVSGTSRTTIAWTADWYFWIVMGAAAVGLVGLARRGERRPQRLLVLVGVIGLLLIPSLLWGNVRFHIPVLPLAAVAAGAAPLAIRARR